MNDNAPQAWSRTVILSGHPQLTPHFRGQWAQVWIYWPVMGISILHSMKKHEAQK